MLLHLLMPARDKEYVDIDCHQWKLKSTTRVYAQGPIYYCHEVIVLVDRSSLLQRSLTRWSLNCTSSSSVLKRDYMLVLRTAPVRATVPTAHNTARANPAARGKRPQGLFLLVVLVARLYHPPHYSGITLSTTSRSLTSAGIVVPRSPTPPKTLLTARTLAIHIRPHSLHSHLAGLARPTAFLTSICPHIH